MNLTAFWMAGLDRHWVPTWQMRAYFLAAATRAAPSGMSWLMGFSM
jgi:hypothetical protein